MSKQFFVVNLREYLGMKKFDNKLYELLFSFSCPLRQCRHNILSHMNIAPICTEAMNEDVFLA